VFKAVETVRPEGRSVLPAHTTTVPPGDAGERGEHTTYSPGPLHLIQSTDALGCLPLHHRVAGCSGGVMRSMGLATGVQPAYPAQSGRLL
jgi:hypothetical protein